MYDKFEKLLGFNNVTAYKVAKETGISATMFSDWKSGKSKPKVDKLLILAKYFDVPVEYFVEEGTDNLLYGVRQTEEDTGMGTAHNGGDKS